MRPTSLTPKVANLWSGGANDWMTTRSLDAQGATLNLGTGATLCISLRRLRQKARKVNSPMVRPFWRHFRRIGSTLAVQPLGPEVHAPIVPV